MEDKKPEFIVLFEKIVKDMAANQSFNLLRDLSDLQVLLDTATNSENSNNKEVQIMRVGIFIKILTALIIYKPRLCVGFNISKIYGMFHRELFNEAYLNILNSIRKAVYENNSNNTDFLMFLATPYDLQTLEYFNMVNNKTKYYVAYGVLEFYMATKHIMEDDMTEDTFENHPLIREIHENISFECSEIYTHCYRFLEPEFKELSLKICEKAEADVRPENAFADEIGIYLEDAAPISKELRLITKQLMMLRSLGYRLYIIHNTTAKSFYHLPVFEADDIGLPALFNKFAAEKLAKTRFRRVLYFGKQNCWIKFMKNIELGVEGVDHFSYKDNFCGTTPEYPLSITKVDLSTVQKLGKVMEGYSIIYCPHSFNQFTKLRCEQINKYMEPNPNEDKKKVLCFSCYNSEDSKLLRKVLKCPLMFTDNNQRTYFTMLKNCDRVLIFSQKNLHQNVIYDARFAGANIDYLDIVENAELLVCQPGDETDNELVNKQNELVATHFGEQVKYVYKLEDRSENDHREKINNIILVDI